ncbi:zinc finger protein 280C-like [Huso huso]|uniref:Zinc finger protein 280C-like n=1 Tax=Huso huso TaxID=61971 RepID=A0ABR0YWH3_HUSHU
MAGLFMECEEEELEPWQKRIPEVTEDDDDDDEPIFVGEITCSKPPNNTLRNNLPRSKYSSPRRLVVQNGTLNRTTANPGSGSNFKATNQHYTSPANPSIMTTSAVYQPVSRPMAASATLQSTPRSSPASLCVQPVSKGMINPIVPQAVVRPSPVQPVSRSLLIPVTTQPVSRPVSIPATAQQMQQTFTAVTAQSIIINNQGYIMTSPQMTNNSGLILGIRPDTGITSYTSGPSFAVPPGVSPQLGRPVQQFSQVRQLMPTRIISNVGNRPLQVQLTSPVQNNIIRLTSGQNSAQIVSPRPQPAQTSSSGLQSTQLSPTSVQSMQISSTKPQSLPISSPKQQSTPQIVNRIVRRGLPPGLGLTKRPAASEMNNTTPKKSKLEPGTPVSSLSINSTGQDLNLKGSMTNSSAYVTNGVQILNACPKCKIHFHVMGPLKNHMKFCCPDLFNNYFPTTSKQETPTTPVKLAEAEAEKGKLVMLVNEFYYGKYEGDIQQEQKTNTTFKCCSCLKLLKNNIRFMNHMKHHLELEKQSNESWENHTTCQHCYRQFSTPFQLQCHIESAHSPYQSTTNCKICELAFESEQVLLQHMKDNHKPGEMPYVCQVCSYRSSVFSDVENHFRVAHENTKHLLCPFCLKVIKCATPYMLHYMRHQKKGVHRCTKCRLQFLTCKEKLDHKTQHHRTFRKPKSLEGLPPGTKVTIRASLASPGGSPTSPNASSRSIVSIIPNSPTAKQSAKAPSNQGKSRSTNQQKKQEKLSNSKLLERSLKKLSVHFGIQKCMECSADIEDCAAHYPTLYTCGVCRYKTSCKKSYAKHMIRFHSAFSREKFRKRKKHSNKLRGVTLVCLNCDFLTDASGANDMSKHLIDRPNHTCQVIVESDTPKVCNDEPRKTEPEDNAYETSQKGNSQKDAAPNIPDEESSPFMESNHSLEEAKRDKAAESQEAVTEGTDSSYSEVTLKKESDLHEAPQGSEIKSETPMDSKTEKTVSDDNVVQIEENDKSQPCEKQTCCKSPVNTDKTKETKEPPENPSANDAETVDLKQQREDDVSFEQFFRKLDESESVSSDVSEQGSIQLEPLTPSEVLEHEATEILQKGGVSSKKKAAPVCENGDYVSKTCKHLDKSKDKQNYVAEEKSES